MVGRFQDDEGPASGPELGALAAAASPLRSCCPHPSSNSVLSVSARPLGISTRHPAAGLRLQPPACGIKTPRGSHARAAATVGLRRRGSSDVSSRRRRTSTGPPSARSQPSPLRACPRPSSNSVPSAAARPLGISTRHPAAGLRPAPSAYSRGVAKNGRRAPADFASPAGLHGISTWQPRCRCGPSAQYPRRFPEHPAEVLTTFEAGPTVLAHAARAARTRFGSPPYGPRPRRRGGLSEGRWESCFLDFASAGNPR